MKILLAAWLLAFGLIVDTAGANESPLPPEARRSAEQTLLTFPEWFLVHSPAEFARTLGQKPAHDFPFVQHIGQLWSGYTQVSLEQYRQRMPLNPGYHAMILVLASSTTVEYGIRSIYENSVGRTSWFLAGEQPTEEDRFSAEVAQEYVDFIRQQPWYLFDFQARLERLWNDVPWWGPDMLRKWERRYLLTSEYLVKAAYGKLIEKATRAAYEVASMDTQVVIDPPPTVLTLPPRTTVLRSLNNGQRVLSLPRYFDFRLAATALAKQGVEFSDIAGNDGDILVTIWLPDDVAAPPLPGRELFAQALQIPADIRRVGMLVKVRDLASFLNLATARNITVEHVHDY